MDVDAVVAEFAESDAGRALAAHGFKAVHQGGGLVNFEAVRGGKILTLMEDMEGGGYGPRCMSLPVLVCVSSLDRSDNPGELGEQSFPSLSAYLRTL